jgi:hypothetical protein
MTRMYPTIADPHAKSPAERRLYETFARKLGDDWVAFHHVKWIGKDDLGRSRDGETDFVVAHPHLGVLVIEVKGGRIRFDDTTGHYTSTDRDGVDHDIGDSFEQATESEHALMARVRLMPRWPRRRVRVSSAH